jgi:DNA-binding CsgD family transcriptional regulator
VTAILRRRADWVDLIESSQGEANDDEAWAHDVVASAKDVFAIEPMLSIVEHSPSCDSARYTTLATSRPELFLAADAGLKHLGAAGFRAMFYPRNVVSTFLDIERSAGADIGKRAAEFRRANDLGDALGIFAYPEPGVIVCLFVTHERAIELKSYDRGLLTQVALHLETSYRLRRRPESVKAVLDIDGRVLERAADAPLAHVLEGHAAHVNRARRERDGDGLGLWPALLAGRLSLVQRRVGSKLRYLVFENGPATRALHALSETEVEVVSQAARGQPTKLIAYGLGVSPSVVSKHLARAAAKVGASSRIDLIRIAAILGRDPRAHFRELAITDAERDVLALVQQGLSNEQIAQMRSRSVRTIANQVASLLRKTQSSSRRELLVMPANG